MGAALLRQMLHKGCYRCSKRGHYSALCHSNIQGTAVNELEVSTVTHLDTAFLGAISDCQQTLWNVMTELNGWKTEFKIDTGAEVTVISDETF
jgi:hypothetical protein